MSQYLLDTNICIYLIKKKPECLLRKLRRHRASKIGISVITLSEMEYGIQKSRFAEQNAISLLRFLVAFNIHPFDEIAAREYGKLRVHLEQAGKPIGNMDMLIGAHAMAIGATLVTNNEREFRRINGLRVENWAK